MQGLLRRRRAVATKWLAQATAAIADTPEASELHSALADHLRRLDAAWQVCGATCADCLLPCCVLGSHAQHSCGTDHRCKADCAFCSEEVRLPGGGAVHSCSGKAGHHGRHMCKDKPHACGKSCALKGRAENCNGVCAREPQHDGECDCECGNHLCGAACSLPGCSHTCKEPWGAPHDRHSCGATACPMVRLSVSMLGPMCPRVSWWWRCLGVQMVSAQPQASSTKQAWLRYTSPEINQQLYCSCDSRLGEQQFICCTLLSFCATWLQCTHVLSWFILYHVTSIALAIGTMDGRAFCSWRLSFACKTQS